MTKNKIAIFLASLLSACTSVPAPNARADSTPHFLGCPDDPARQKLRSEELQKIVKEDQDDRQGSPDSIDWSKVSPRDEARRKRIGEIFGEGCFKTAPDYSAAALVYQHGNIPDHFFQTFLWAKKAVDLGDSSQRSLMALGIDRYLVNIGHKEFFASQASKVNGDTYWCLEEVEQSFPDSLRLKYRGTTLKQAKAWVDSLNQNAAGCMPTKICEKNLKDSPLGTVPGFW